jgi:hypothetical protein
MTGRIALLVAIVALVMSSWWVAAGQASRGAARTQAGATAQVTVLGQGAKTFTGTGRKSLGQIRLERRTTLSWLHPRGGRLQITTGTKRPFLLLSTTRKQGSIALRRGTYNAVRVATRGAWRIQLRTAK